MIVADFHDFRKVFDQGKNNVRRIDRNSVDNLDAYSVRLKWATGCLRDAN